VLCGARNHTVIAAALDILNILWQLARAMADDETEAAIDVLKQQGNAAFQAKDCAKAVQKYTEALRLGYESECEEQAHILLSNRVAALLGHPEHDEILLENAFRDAESCCGMAPNWSKAHYRMGQALEARHKLMISNASWIEVDKQQQLEQEQEQRPWVEAYKSAWRRRTVPQDRTDRAIEAALQRCGVNLGDVKIELPIDENLLEDMLDLDDKRLKKVHGSTDDLPAMPAATDSDGKTLPGTGTRTEQKALMAMMIAEMGDFETHGGKETAFFGNKIH
jgi:tetratricopeptide (TPR) repeat protein